MFFVYVPRDWWPLWYMWWYGVGGLPVNKIHIVLRRILILQPPPDVHQKILISYSLSFFLPCGVVMWNERAQDYISLG